MAQQPAARLPDGAGNAPDADITRVLIVEDHRVVAEGLAALINDQPDMKVVGNVGTVADVVDAAAQLDPDVVLLEIGRASCRERV